MANTIKMKSIGINHVGADVYQHDDVFEVGDRKIVERLLRLGAAEELVAGSASALDDEPKKSGMQSEQAKRFGMSKEAAAEVSLEQANEMIADIEGEGFEPYDDVKEARAHLMRNE